MEEIREPKQKRAIQKKEAIIEAGFNLICKNGYYNTNTAEIAKTANVSTGIIYQYFKDKHDILMEALEVYGDDIFFPIIKLKKEDFQSHNFDKAMKEMLNKYINNHKLSKTAHEELTAMTHSDQEVANYFYKKELAMTNSIKQQLLDNNFQDNNLNEKVHIMLGLIDNLCHEIIYHKHINMNYEIMTNLVLKNIRFLFKNDLPQ